MVAPTAPAKTSGRTFGWQSQLDKGAQGMALLVALLRERGREVVDVSDLPEAQARDIDLLVDGRHAEVKSDFNRPRNLFIEITCDGKPGCVFKSRADDWYYFFPLTGRLVLLNLARLQHHIALHGHEYERRHVRSAGDKGAGWGADGLLLPLADVEKYDIGRIVA